MSPWEFKQALCKAGVDIPDQQLNAIMRTIDVQVALFFFSQYVSASLSGRRTEMLTVIAGQAVSSPLCLSMMERQQTSSYPLAVM